MTIPAGETSISRWVGNGVTQEFDYQFKITSKDDLLVNTISPAGALATMSEGTDYTVQDVGKDSGYITLTVALTDTWKIQISDNLAVSQEVPFGNQTRFFASAHESAFDKATRLIKRLFTRIEDCIRVTSDDTEVNLELPSASSRANKFLSFGAAGEVDLATSISNTTLSRSNIGEYLWPRTQAEIDSSVTPVNLYYQPGWVERYLANATPGTTDMAAGFTNAFKQAKEIDGATVRGEDRYKLGSTVDCREAKVDLRDSTIDISHSGIGIIAGGHSDGPTNPEQRFGTVLRVGAGSGTDSATYPTIKIMGAYGQHIHIHYTGYIQLYADSDDGAVGDSDAIAYSTFWFNRMTTMEWNTNPSPSGSTTQWINENTFYLNRMGTFICDGTYPHNNNRLWGGNMEAASASVGATITFTKGHTNTWNDIRFERTGTRPFVEMTFGADSHGNKIFQSWMSSLADYTTESIYGNTAFDKVTDAGYNNQVLKTSSMSRQTFVIAHASIDDPIFNTTVGQTFGSGFFTTVVTSPADQKPSLFSLQTLGSNDYIMSTDLFRVKRGDIIGWNTETFSSVSPGYRSYFYCYDEDGAEILPVVSSGAADMSTDNCFSGQLSAAPPNRLGPTGNNSKESVTILGPNIAFMKIVWLSGSAAATTNTARSITAYIRRGMSMATENITQTCVPDVKQKFLAVSGVPTQGFAKVGYSVCDIDGSHHVVDRSVDTTLASGASLGATTVVLTDATGIASGDVIGILNDVELVTDWRIVDSVAGSPSITLTVGLTGAAAAGNRVVFLHWITE